MSERKIVQVIKVNDLTNAVRMTVLANDGTIWDYVRSSKGFRCWVRVECDLLPQPKPATAPRFEGYDPAFMPAGASLAPEPSATSELNSGERASVGLSAQETAVFNGINGAGHSAASIPNIFASHDQPSGQLPHPDFDRAKSVLVIVPNEFVARTLQVAAPSVIWRVFGASLTGVRADVVAVFGFNRIRETWGEEQAEREVREHIRPRQRNAGPLLVIP